MHEPPKPRPGYRIVPITVVFHLYEEIPDDWEDGGRFHIEENHCIDNYVQAMARDIDGDPSHCQTCDRAETYLGHLPFSEIRSKVQAALPAKGYTPPTSIE